jgi:hypothetical protein
MERRFQRFLPALVLLVLMAKIHLPTILDPHRMDGDARQHVFWTYRFQDPDLFPNDPLVAFISSPRFDPLGYQALYAVGARAMDPLFFSKVMGAVLSLLLGTLAFQLCRREHGQVAGIFAIILIGFLCFDNQRTALPRAFAFSVILLALFSVMRHRPWLGGLSLLLAALFYPPAFVSGGILLPLLLLGGEGTLRQRLTKLIVPIGLLGGVALGIIVLSTRFMDRELTGPLVTKAQSLLMPEFYEGGRNHFWRSDWVEFYLGSWNYNRSACDLLTREVMYPLGGAAFLWFVLRRSFRCPRPILWLVISSALLFVLAHASLFLLYQPNRFTA